MKIPKPLKTVATVSLLTLSASCLPPPPTYTNLTYFEAHPHLDNETLGMLNYLESIAITPGSYFPLTPWGDSDLAIPDAMGGGSNWLRYMLGFLGYASGMAAETTPAYSGPYVDIMDGLITKMQDHQVWDYWLSQDWGGDNPIYPYNIMYSAHLQLMMAFHERAAGDGKYIDNDITLVTSDGSQSWTTNLEALSADIHDLILTNVDANGDNFYGVQCETPTVFVVCNAVPQMALEFLPPSLKENGLDPAAVHEPWLEWIDSDDMIDPVTMHNYFAFYPNGEEDDGVPSYRQLQDDGVTPWLSGGYSSWAYAFTHAFAPQWIEDDVYPTFMQNALEDLGGASDSGAAIVRWGNPGQIAGTDVISGILDMAGTGYAMWLAKEVNDIDTYERLQAGFLVTAKSPQWNGEKFGYFNVVNWPIYQVIPLGFDLLGRVLSSDVNFRSVAENPRGADFYTQPILASVSNSGTFVNQAIWADSTLYITINGGHITEQSTDLVIENLDADSNYEVLLNGEVYTAWTKTGTQLTITTPPLSGSETQRYQVL